MLQPTGTELVQMTLVAWILSRPVHMCIDNSHNLVSCNIWTNRYIAFSLHRKKTTGNSTQRMDLANRTNINFIQSDKSRILTFNIRATVLIKIHMKMKISNFFDTTTDQILYCKCPFGMYRRRGLAFNAYSIHLRWNTMTEKKYVHLSEHKKPG